MKKITATVIGLNNAVKPPRQVPVEVEGYEIEPGWVVHRALDASLKQRDSCDWAVSHIGSGRGLLAYCWTRKEAVEQFRALKKDGFIADTLKKLKELEDD